MAFDQPTRNRLQKLVSEARSLLTIEFTRQLQNDYGLDPESGNISPVEVLTGLDDERLSTAKILRETFNHYQSTTPGENTKDLLERIVREQAFTMLNRFAAIRMAEARGILFASISNGYQSKGFQLYSRVAGSGLGTTFDAYRNYIFSVFDELALDLAVLFDRFSPFGRLFPRQAALEELLGLLNDPEIDQLWAEDETIGWIYQYFNSKEERKKMRDESAAPRNSRELAVRNQFFTPRYVVEFLTDNTLGRTWYEMTRGDTALAENCRYLVRRPNEIFLESGKNAPLETEESNENLSQEELLKQPVYIPHRPLKDPRELLMLDPACGSMHFGLYAFDLFLTIYEEAWQLEELKGAGALTRSHELKSIHETYENDKERFSRDVPRLIIENNIHGADIDPRAVQIAGLSLWLRAQRAWQQQDVKSNDRPQIRRSNIVCAEPMPGEADLLEEFIAKLFADTAEKRLLGEFVRRIFDSMKLAGEAGSLLKIEGEVANLVSESREQWSKFQESKESFLFEGARINLQPGLDFEIGEITDERFWDKAEGKVYKALHRYAETGEATSGYQRRLFADDAERGFAFIDLCRRTYDVVLMNPPFGDASAPSKPYIDETYGDTKGDVYKAFVECFQDRLVPSGFLGIISSRTGFFLSSSADWRERIVLRLYRPLLLADFGMGVLDAMVETAAYVLRSLTEKEDRELTLQLLPELENMPTDKNDVFSTKKYQDARGLKRFQAIAELNRLQTAGFIKFVEGSFPRWTPYRGMIARAQIPQSSPFPPLVCFRVLKDRNKESVLLNAVAGHDNPNVFVADVNSFSLVSNTAFTYWVSPKILEKLNAFPDLEGSLATIRVGLQTGEDWRFLRQWWEVNVNDVVDSSKISYENQSELKASIEQKINDAAKWIFYSKTDFAAPWYSPLLQVVNWSKFGDEMLFFLGSNGKSRSRIQNPEFYFQSGFSYMLRSTRLVPYIVPSGSIPTAGRSQVFPLEDHTFDSIAVCASNLGSAVARFNGEKFQFPKFQASMVQGIPAADFNKYFRDELRKFIVDEISRRRKLFQGHEPFLEFVRPAFLENYKESLAWNKESLLNRDLELKIANEYGLEPSELAQLERDIIDAFESQNRKVAIEEDSENEDSTNEAEVVDESKLALFEGLISYCIGCALGRWDVRFTTRERPVPVSLDPFAPLSVCPPGMLQNGIGLPATPEDVPTDYPVEIVWNGILIDDAGNPNDIENCLREVLQVVWKDRADAIETEACEILGVPSLREYFRRPTGFFADHLKRYSKSRRQAPIYLPLSTKSGDYTLWLYYHRLTDQTLYAAVNDFVDPKLRQVKDEAASLGSKHGRSRDDEKRLEHLTGVTFELEELRDELLRLAPVWKPNLNDGVQITVSPLWKLFRLPKWRKTLEDTWKKLEKGDYDWAHLAYSFFPERVREKCRHDKSLAIAHDLEDIYEEPPPKTRRERTKQAQTAPLPLADG